MLGVMTSTKPRVWYSPLTSSMRELKILVPWGSQNVEPGDISSQKKSFWS